ncbi:MAG: 4-phosphoerythronate dehydrogenase [Ignavibacteria bacterium]|nr:4-phosphoerythronate dehydrogenase [Ignavibacteria bacterium]
MNILIDKKTPFGTEAFTHLGTVATLGSHEMTQEAVRDADVLIVRSETRVTRDLLEGSRVRFVGTTTIGTDHVDLDYLASRGIGFASAPGCNANSVKEYVVAALLTLAVRHGSSLRGKRLGIVGIGNIGSRMVEAAGALGMEVLQNDPPLQRRTGEQRYVALDDLMEADYITLHVPLTKSGDDPTYHLFDKERIGRMRKDSYLINTSRGAVVQTVAIKEALAGKRIAGAVLDVWEKEPNIDVELLKLVELATPHIAGYSFDGKVNAVRMIASAVCDHFECKEKWKVPTTIGMVPLPSVDLPASPGGMEQDLLRVVSGCYDIERDDARLHGIIDADSAQRGAYFSNLRAGYPLRREFSNTTVRTTGGASEIAETLRKLGFVTAEQ